MITLKSKIYTRLSHYIAKYIEDYTILSYYKAKYIKDYAFLSHYEVAEDTQYFYGSILGLPNYPSF